MRWLWAISAALVLLGCGGKTEDGPAGAGGAPGAGATGNTGGSAAMGGATGGTGFGASGGSGGTCSGPYMACVSDADCCGGNACNGGCCGCECAPNGVLCLQDFVCCSGLCHAGQCVAGACAPVGANCDYFNPSCCAGLECSLIGICSEVASCSGVNQPCASGCCAGLECTANGLCAAPPPPQCPPGASPCAACISGKCCLQLSACMKSAACAKGYYCLEQCLAAGAGAAQCLSQCDTGAPELQPLGLCAYQSCLGACGG